MFLDDACRNGEAEPGAAGVALGGEERVGQVGEVPFGDPDSLVGHG